MNRLVTQGEQSVCYDIKGNITNNTAVGTFGYGRLKPYSISVVTPTSNAIPLREQAITYNDMMRPASISENNYDAFLTYNGAGERSRMILQNNGNTQLTRYYIDNKYERDESATIVKERLYIGGDAYSASAVLLKNGSGAWNIYYICRDYLGSITHVTDEAGNLVQELSYSPWGRLRNPDTQAVYAPDNEPELFLGRGYTGHEHLATFGLINMNARLYDPVLGRFLSPDPYVQMPYNSQNFNRYSYALNNPLVYVDENGEFIFSLFFGPIGAIIDGICWGAVIGAGTAGAVYSVATLVTGQQWNSGDFWRSVGMGAVGGALGAGLGAVGTSGLLGSFGNSFGYNMLSQISNSMITDVVFGNDINMKSVFSMTAAAIVGGTLPGFQALKGSAFKNAMAEIGYNTLRGATTGLVSGLVDAGINKDANRIWQGMAGGAVGGMGRSLFMNLAFGAPYKVDKSYGESGLYRNGGLSSFLINKVAGSWGGGLTLGRNMYTNLKNGADYLNEEIRYHENYHVYQQNKEGWAGFYGKTISQYIKYGFSNTYDTPGTLEYGAERYARIKMGVLFY